MLLQFSQLVSSGGSQITAIAYPLLVLSLTGGRVLSGLLYEIQPTDPLALGAAALLLLLVALAATALPAWRATPVAPADALRNE